MLNNPNEKDDYLNSYLLISDNIVVEAGSCFTVHTGYEKSDILGKSMEELCSLLKLDKIIFNNCCSLPHILNVSTGNSETKQFEVIRQDFSFHNEQVYYFRERASVNFKERMPLFYQLYLDNILGVAIYSISDMTLLLANQTYLDFFDEPFRKAENTLGKKMYDFIPGWNKSPSRDFLHKIINTGEIFHIDEYEFTHFQRGTTYWNCSLIPIKENGIIKYVVEITTEITERVAQRKIIENQTRIITENNNQLQVILESMSDGLFTLDRMGEINCLNDSAREFFYCGSSKFLSGDQLAYTRYYDLEGNPVNLGELPGHRVLQGEKIRECILKAVRPDGIYYYDVSGRPVYNENDDILMAVVCVRNITDKIGNEQEIRRQRDELYEIFTALDLPIIRLSYPDLKIIELNSKCYNFLYIYTKGKLPGFINGKSIFEYIPNFMSCLNSEQIKIMKKTKSSVYRRHVKVALEDRTIYYNLILEPILGINNEIQEIMIIGFDITSEVHEKKEIEKVMRLQEEFFSFIAHEFRTPLTTINSSIQLLELVYQNDMTDNIRRYISTIKRNTFQQLRLVNNLLDVTRAEAGYLKVHRKNYEIVSITSAIAESIKIFAASKGINIKFITTFDKKYIAIDDEKYERILLNLLSNAIKFTPEGKSITITLSSRDNQVLICINDEGIGIPADKQAVIFERFGQTESKRSREGEGTGIGLYLVKLLVEGMGGEIILNSTEGKGTTFTIIVPDTIVETQEEESLPELTNNRLVQSMQIEFSNIYLL